jgi:hypothetical protein
MRLGFNVKKWHMLRYITSEEGQGPMILYSNDPPFYYGVLFPGIKTVDLLKKLKEGKDIELYFVNFSKRIRPDKCKMCNGAGKLDWISKTTHANLGIKDFIQDDRKFLGFNTTDQFPNLSSQFILSVTKINRQEGEEYCDKCSGTGIKIDGRFRIFQPFKKLQKHLVFKDY